MAAALASPGGRAQGRHAQVDEPVTPNAKGLSATNGVSRTPISNANGRPGDSTSVQIIDEHQAFNPAIRTYLDQEDVLEAGFDYHVISVFGSQSTGKSTLLNQLFGTHFDVMSESERRQTTKGIWMSKNRRTTAGPAAAAICLANNILVLDVEGTDGRERGEDQDFERKAALFALATSEILIVNIWEHQVGLYQGANMGLLKVVFEVNLELFLKGRDRQASPRSLLFFVIRDHLGTTPLANLRNTLAADLTRIWAGLNKPAGLEKARIDDYFDFAFAALPHKVLQPERFSEEVAKLGARFRAADRPQSPAKSDKGDGVAASGLLHADYHRRIPADGFTLYAENIWDQIVNNKDLDLPTQQELLAQFRCDEIMREVLVEFDQQISPLETRQSENIRSGEIELLENLGASVRSARSKALQAFDEQASRYNKGVFSRKHTELESKIDARLKTLYQGQVTAAHKIGIRVFAEEVSGRIKDCQRKAINYDFGDIVAEIKAQTLKQFHNGLQSLALEGVAWTKFTAEEELFRKDLDRATSQLRREEMRRLASRIERWIKAQLSDSIFMEFGSLGSGRAGGGAPEDGRQPPGEALWDRIWSSLERTVEEAADRYTKRAKSFDATPDEVQIGLWRLRRRSWAACKAKIDEEMMEGNLLMKLHENFEDKFRYDEAGVPRIWRPTDDIETIYTRAREATMRLIPLLSCIKLQRTSESPPLPEWIGVPPASATLADEDDMAPIGGIDDDTRTLNDEMTILSESRRQDVIARFKKTADGVYVEAKRSAIGGITQVPLYFYGILLALGWNELLAVFRNPFLFMLLILMAAGAYITFTLNLWGPLLKMTNAASGQALEEFKKRLRDFLETTESGRQAMAMPASNGSVPLRKLDATGKARAQEDPESDLDTT